MAIQSGVKPMIKIGLNATDNCPLRGCQALASVDASKFFHRSRGMRAPLGIYNASIAKVCPRVSRFCEDIEPLFLEIRIDPQRESASRRAKVAESLESMLYAAAEHVDDVESLASGFFKTHPLAKRDSRYKELSNRIDKCKKLTSTIANKLKHEQARIRLYSLEIRHGEVAASLHGFIVEGASDGVIGPHRTVHSVHPVLSLTTLAWEVLEFIVTASLALARFLTYFPKQDVEQPSMRCPHFTDAVKAAARLPTYTFGEPHPFSRTTFQLLGDGNEESGRVPEIYGSVYRRWSQSNAMEFGSFAMTTEGDGVSKAFALAKPSNVSLVHWT